MVTKTAERKLTPGQRRTAKARAAASRRAEQRRADFLRERGWTCTPPADETKE